MVDQRKQAISIRLGAGDVRNVKRIAKRLGVRDSEIIRYAIKSMFGRLSPLCDEAIAGRNLLPVLVESGDELIRYFELDSFRLDGIINQHAEENLRVNHDDDIALLTMSGLRDQYLVMRMKDGNGVVADQASASRSLGAYLYEKYIYRSADTKSGEGKPVEAEPRNGAQRPAA